MLHEEVNDYFHGYIDQSHYTLMVNGACRKLPDVGCNQRVPLFLVSELNNECYRVELGEAPMNRRKRFSQGNIKL